MAAAVDFYAHKSAGLPRFIYRNLAAALRESPGGDERAALLRRFVESLETEARKGDYLKFKWVLPGFVRQLLTTDEQAAVDEVLRRLRVRQGSKLFDVYPHCSDEFSLDADFLAAAFDATPRSLFDATTPIFTIGSCFARNIAVFLQAKGFNVTNFGQVEDLNSPHSNAAMLAAAAATDDQRLTYVRAWLDAILTGTKPEVIAKVCDRECERLVQLRQKITASRLLIVTLGNIIDYHLPVGHSAPTLAGVNVAPKFLGVTESEDVEVRSAFSKALRRAGVELRLGTYEEARTAICALHQAVRSMNPAAPIVYTLSPVPIDSAVGVHKWGGMGAIEIDSVSKSTLRVAIHDFLMTHAGTEHHYFPAYEIVRGVGGMLPVPNFGAEDAASRHVSAHILEAVYEFFLRKHGPSLP
jgi:hypothetical protein